MALDLDPYVKKLLNARRRVVLVNNILQNAQVRGHRDLGGSQSPPEVLTGEFWPVQGFGEGSQSPPRCSQLNFGLSRDLGVNPRAPQVLTGEF